MDKHNHNHEHIHHYHEHSGAVVLSTDKIVFTTYTETESKLIFLLGSLTQWINDSGGIVGHIKAFIVDPGTSSAFSSTGGEVQVKRLPNSGIKVSITAIVFNINTEEMEHEFLDMIKKL